MVTPTVFHGSTSYPHVSPGPVVTVGNFDGVHLGHQALVGRAVERARASGAPACVFTFDPMPIEVLRPERAGRRLMRLQDRVAALGALGVDHIVVERFDRDYAAHDAAWFAVEVLRGRLGASELMLGWDFRFGKDRGGTPDDLRSLLAVPVEQLAPVLADGEPISSSRIRAAVERGHVEDAARWLGRPHRLTGEVTHGDRRGRTIGFPTANVPITGLLPPALGVYAVVARAGGDAWGGVANIGVRPTFGGDPAPRLEAHLFDYEGGDALYGRELAVELRHFVREERRFPSFQELVAQIREDAARARELLAPWYAAGAR